MCDVETRTGVGDDLTSPSYSDISPGRQLQVVAPIDYFTGFIQSSQSVELSLLKSGFAFELTL